MTSEAIRKQQLDIAIIALKKIEGRQHFGPGVAELALEKIDKLENALHPKKKEK